MKKRIIIVEDEMDWQKRFAKTLKGLGHEVVKVYSKAEGVLEELEKFRPDLFLIDINLREAEEGAEKSGIKLGRKIGSMGIPYILITQLEEDKYHTQAYRNSARPRAYIKKAHYGAGFGERMRLLIKEIFIDEEFFNVRGEQFSYSNVCFVYKTKEKGASCIKFNNRKELAIFQNDVNLNDFLEGGKYYCESFYKNKNYVINLKNVLGLTRAGKHSNRGRLFLYFNESDFEADSPNNPRIKNNPTAKLRGLVVSANSPEFMTKLRKYCQEEIRKAERTSDILIKNTLA